MHKLDRLVLLSRYVVEGNLAGAHRSPLKGASSEFADHKAYGMGDDPKHIDWRVFGRTEKHYIKRYEDDTNLRVYLAIDRSNSMAYTSGKEYQVPVRLPSCGCSRLRDREGPRLGGHVPALQRYRCGDACAQLDQPT